MTKILNFTAVEILPKLLSKEKTQTIRRAWEKHTNCRCPTGIHPKPAKYKVGERVQIMWKQKSKNKLFCSCHGLPIKRGQVFFLAECKSPKIKTFEKKLGEVEITDVFKMNMSNNELFIFNRLIPINLTDLAKADGFKSAEQMFAYFDKNYSLDTPKPFWVYRWKWLL